MPPDHGSQGCYRGEADRSHFLGFLTQRGCQTGG